MTYSGERRVEMYGPEPITPIFSYVAVFSYVAKFSDQDIIFNVDKRIGGTKDDLKGYAQKLAIPFGRVPFYVRTGTKIIDVHYGKIIYVSFTKL